MPLASVFASANMDATEKIGGDSISRKIFEQRSCSIGIGGCSVRLRLSCSPSLACWRTSMGMREVRVYDGDSHV
jgi:hypothetical protein